MAREGFITTQFISSNADSLHCAPGIVGLYVPEEKKVKFLLRKLNSEEVEASQDGEPLGFKNFMTI